jgi:hypothetical protein
MTSAAQSRWYRDDFEAFAAEVLHLPLYSKQRELIRAVLDHERVACRAGNAVGKTWAAAFLILFWLAGGPGSVVVSTSATEAQLRRVLWRQVGGLFKKTGGYFVGATRTETEILMAPGWFATGFSTDTPEALQGIHAERVLVVVDEASGVDEMMFEAAEGLLATGKSRLLLIGNPLRTSGLFFDAFHTKQDEWHTLTISAYDTPAFTGEEVPRKLQKSLVDPKWVERFERRGRDSNEFMVRVLGEFPLRQDDAVFSRVALEQAHSQTLEAGVPIVFGFDPARFGGDESVLYLRQGNVVRLVDAWQGLDLMASTGRVVDHVRRVQEATGRRVRIVVDEPGLGGGVIDRLREQRLEVVAFNGANRAHRRKVAPNRRSELFLDGAEILPLLDLDPGDSELARELLSPTYSFDSTGAKVVERKTDTRRRLGRSPDRLDALLLTLSVDPPRVPGQPKKGATILVARRHMRDFGRDPRRTFPTVPQTSAHDPVAGLRPVADPVAETLARFGVGTVNDDSGLYDLKRMS